MDFSSYIPPEFKALVLVLFVALAVIGVNVGSWVSQHLSIAWH